MALKAGQKRVNDSREYLNKFANGKAMPALALKDNKTNVWVMSSSNKWISISVYTTISST